MLPPLGVEMQLMAQMNSEVLCGPPQEIKLLSLHSTGIGRGVEIKISNAITAKVAILER